ncbi:MAG: thioesterase family protein [Alphaproteobacteria bacterium]
MTGPLLTLYRGVVRPEWIDYNGHMNDGFYAVAFGLASEGVQDHIGMDAGYRALTGCTLYTAEAHIVFLRELKEGQPIHVTSRLLGVDAKRIHLFHHMHATTEGYMAATFEVMLLHVDQAVGRTAPIPDDLLGELEALAAAHGELPRPEEAGRAVRSVRPTE